MEQQIPPAIVRDECEADHDMTVLSKPTDTVTSKPGWGDSGYRVEIVEHDCPTDHCSFDRMIRRHDVKGDGGRNEMRYWCLNPNCAHFVRDELSYACKGSYPNRVAREPVVFEKREVEQ